MPKDLSIGLSKKHFKVGKPNSFTIFGEGIGILTPPPPPPAPPATLPKVYVTACNHLWGSATVSRKHDDGINVDVRCLKRKKPGGGRIVKTAADGDDDVTITIVFDEGGGNEEFNECTFPDADYDDAPPPSP
jgi:hypothetical protein